jgi:ABC-type molybdate transport system permease subunit
VFALPLAIAVSVYIVHYAPLRLRTSLSYVVEVLAAVPSIIFGLWGLLWFVPTLVQPVTNWVARNLGFIPLPRRPGANVNYFHAGFVLAIMILPIITALTREIIAAAPLSEQEAAYGLGATKWEVIRSVVLPRSFSGIVGASMLGLGRALGETIAVLMLVGGSQRFGLPPVLLRRHHGGAHRRHVPGRLARDDHGPARHRRRAVPRDDGRQHDGPRHRLEIRLQGDGRRDMSLTTEPPSRPAEAHAAADEAGNAKQRERTTASCGSCSRS